MTLFAGLAIVAIAVFAVLRKVDVRLALLLAALALGVLSGTPALIVRTFVSTFSSEQFVVPIGCAVGFAYVLRHTGCEQHLVQLLVRPLRRAAALLIPGVVLVGFAVNVPVISQVGTAVSIGAVLVPLLRARGCRRSPRGRRCCWAARWAATSLTPARRSGVPSPMRCKPTAASAWPGCSGCCCWKWASPRSSSGG